MSIRPEPDPPPTPIQDVISTGSPSPGAEPPLLDTERVPRRPPKRAPGRGAVRLAWAVAIAIDAVQWVLWPLFTVGGAVSPFDDILDVIVGVVLIRLLGWHWAFLPAFIAEIIPGANLVPTWTAAVFLATRNRDKDPTPRA